MISKRNIFLIFIFFCVTMLEKKCATDIDPLLLHYLLVVNVFLMNFLCQTKQKTNNKLAEKAERAYRLQIFKQTPEFSQI
jgi:hypothetical protein